MTGEQIGTPGSVDRRGQVEVGGSARGQEGLQGTEGLAWSRWGAEQPTEGALPGTCPP